MDDYNKYIEEFNKVDIKNHQLLKKWFLDHPYLSIHDHAIISGRSIKQVRRWKYKVGLKGTTHANTKRPINIALPESSIEVPENWRTQEWLQKSIDQHGLSAVSRALNLTRRSVYLIAKKLDIQLRGNGSKNPCCTKSWCHRHYVELGYSANKCAKLANITRPKFIEWLVKFNIPILKAWQQHRPKNFTLELRHTVTKLKNHHIVKNVHEKRHWLKVAYNYGLTSRYYYATRTNEDWRLNEILEPYYEYDRDLLTGHGYNCHIALPHDKFLASNKLEKWISMHAFCDKLISQGWLWPFYPQHVLDGDLLLVNKIKESRLMRDGHFTAICKSHAGRKILVNYFDQSEYFNKLLKSPFKTYHVAKQLINNKENKINTTNFIYATNKQNLFLGIKYPPASFYRFLFKRLKIRNILDLDVGCGSHALGCALAGVEYIHMNDCRFNKAIDLGFPDFVSLRHSNYDGSVVDLIFSDGDLNINNYNNKIEQALAMGNKARQILIMVPKEQKRELQLKYKPRSIIKIISRYIFDNDYYFLW